MQQHSFTYEKTSFIGALTNGELLGKKCINAKSTIKKKQKKTNKQTHIS